MKIEILNLERDLQTGFIKSCNWKATKTIGDNVADVFEFTIFEPSNPMIPYLDVTENDVLDWLHKNMDQDKIEKNLDNQLLVKTNQTTAVGFPWRVASS